jgi:hypothetical protein
LYESTKRRVYRFEVGRWVLGGAPFLTDDAGVRGRWQCVRHVAGKLGRQQMQEVVRRRIARGERR